MGSIMKRKDFLKSLLGLAVAPMALANVKEEKTYKQITREPFEFGKSYPKPDYYYKMIEQYREDWEDVLIYGMPRKYIDGNHYMKLTKLAQDRLNSQHSYILKGIKDYIK